MALTVKQLAMGTLKHKDFTSISTPAANELYKVPAGKSTAVASMSFVNNASTTNRSVHLFFLPNGASQTVESNFIKFGCYNGFAPDAGGDSRYLITDEITLGAGDRLFGYSGTTSGDDDKIDFVISGVERDV